MARFLTTHQIAGLLGVSERTVANWIDRGHLDAFRTPGGHRRVSPGGLREFLYKRNIPVPEEVSEDMRILIVEDDPLVAQTLREASPPHPALHAPPSHPLFTACPHAQATLLRECDHPFVVQACRTRKATPPYMEGEAPILGRRLRGSRRQALSI